MRAVCTANVLRICQLVRVQRAPMQSDTPGKSGPFQGGGGGGSVREAGGAFGKIEAAREEEYFRRLQKEQLKNLQHQLDEEVTHHERELARHQESIDRHKKRMRELKHESDNL